MGQVEHLHVQKSPCVPNCKCLFIRHSTVLGHWHGSDLRVKHKYTTTSVGEIAIKSICCISINAGLLSKLTNNQIATFRNDCGKYTATAEEDNASYHNV